MLQLEKDSKTPGTEDASTSLSSGYIFGSIGIGLMMQNERLSSDVSVLGGFFTIVGGIIQYSQSISMLELDSVFEIEYVIAGHENGIIGIFSLLP